MPLPKTIVAFCLLGALCSQGQAREPEARGNRLQIDLTYLSSSSVSESFFAEATVSETTFGAGITARFPNGFHVRARLSSTDRTEVELDDFGFVETFDPDERYTTGTVGIGYRFGRDDGASFWGLGLRGSAVEDAATGTATVFREKDTARRHGVIALGYTTGENELEAFSLTGRHVWFGSESGIGPGVIWNVTRGSGFSEIGTFEDEVDITGFSLGLVLMFRERS